MPYQPNERVLWQRCFRVLDSWFSPLRTKANAFTVVLNCLSYEAAPASSRSSLLPIFFSFIVTRSFSQWFTSFLYDHAIHSGSSELRMGHRLGKADATIYRAGDPCAAHCFLSE